MKHLKLNLIPFLIAIFLMFTSCTSTKTAIFDHYSYQKTTELKVTTAKLMDKSTSPYTTHKEEVETLLLNIEKLAEYEKNKPNNEIAFAIWALLNDNEKNLLAGFFKRWETKGILSPAFVKESKTQVIEALDLLIQFETKKDKESKEALLDLISSNT